MSELIFYTNPQSRGRIVRWMLEETGADYGTKVVEYGADMKSEPFISINPMGKVPAIVHNNNVVTETPAILSYLADAFPEAMLAPALKQRHDYYRCLFFAAGPLESAILNSTMGFELPEKNEATSGYGTLDLCVKVLSLLIQKAPYVCGDSFTAADVYLGSHIGWGMQFGTLPETAEFKSYFDKVSNREAYQRANDLDNALMPKPELEN